MLAFSETANRVPIFALLAAFAGIVTWSVLQTYVVDMTLVGYGVEHFAYFETHPELYVGDFPIGIQNYHVSLPMMVYPWALKTFGIEPTTTAIAVVAFQALLVTAGVYYLARSLDAHPGLALVVVAVVLVSSLPGVNLSGFAQGIKGQISPIYYGFAQGFRFFALACFFRDRPVPGAAFLALSIISHPIIGALTVAFVGAYYVVRWRTLFTRRIFLPFAATAIVGAAYLTIVLAGKSSGAEQMSVEDFVRATRSFSFHWNPISRGFFTFNFDKIGAPVLFATFMGWIGLRVLPLGDERTLRLVAGSSMMLLLAGAGVLFTDIWPNIFMLKLSPQRGTELVTCLGVVIALIYLGHTIVTASWSWKIAAAAALGALLVPERIVFLPAVLPIVVLQLHSGWFGPWQFSANPAVKMVVALAVLCGSLIGLLLTWPAFFPTRFGYVEFVFLAAASLGVVAIPSARAASAALIIVLLVFVSHYRWDDAQSYLARKGTLGTDFKAAQEWARTYTAEGSLFMVDPSFTYGWRDYSRRPSFGNFHEWAMHGYGYDTNPDVYREGLRRLALFSLDPIAMATAERAHGRSLWHVYRHMRGRMHEVFNAMALDDIMTIAQRENVAYVVLFNDDYVGDRTGYTAIFKRPEIAIYEVEN